MQLYGGVGGANGTAKGIFLQAGEAVAIGVELPVGGGQNRRAILSEPPRLRGAC